MDILNRENGLENANDDQELPDLAENMPPFTSPPSTTPAPCLACGNPIHWEDPYHGLHCGGCVPASSTAMLVRAWVAARCNGVPGYAWADVTDRMRWEWLSVGGERPHCNVVVGPANTGRIPESEAATKVDRHMELSR